jgi:hypothetical protein
METIAEPATASTGASQMALEWRWRKKYPPPEINRPPCGTRHVVVNSPHSPLRSGGPLLAAADLAPVPSPPVRGTAPGA